MATMTRAQRLNDIKRYGALVEALKIREPRSKKTIEAVNWYADFLKTTCSTCVGRIDPVEDLVEVVNGQSYHSGCEPY